MPIEFNCQSCQSILRTPDDSAGKAARCPNCGNIEPIPGADLDLSDSKAGSLPPIDEPYFDTDYSQPPQEKAPYAVQSNPYAPSPYSAPPLAIGYTPERSARSMVQAPAITLLVLCSLGVLLASMSAVGGIISLVENNKPSEDIVGLIGCGSVILLQSIGVVGCISMLQMRNYGLSITGVICAMIGGICCCLLPTGIGIWALVTLLQPDVKQHFR